MLPQKKAAISKSRSFSTELRRSYIDCTLTDSKILVYAKRNFPHVPQNLYIGLRAKNRLTFDL